MNSKKLAVLIKPYHSLAEAICARVGYRNIHAWCNPLIHALSPQPDRLQSEKIENERVIHLLNAGLRLTFSHPHARYSDEGDADRWIFRQADFMFIPDSSSSWDGPAPFNLDPEGETPDSARVKLSDDFTQVNEDLKQSYFLDDGLVACLTWRTRARGIASITVVKLGVDSDFIVPAATQG